MSSTLDILGNPRYYILHIAIVTIAVVLIGSLIYEMKKPIKDPNEDKDTKRMNDILED